MALEPSITDLTMVLFTHNRPRMLRELLAFYTSRAQCFKIVVHDSSAMDVQQETREALAPLAPGVDYVGHPPGTTHWAKICSAAEHVQTEFVLMAADDDVFYLPGVLAALDFLRAHADYAACQGSYYYGAKYDELQQFQLIPEMSMVPHDGPHPFSRIAGLLCRFQDVFYAVQRTEAFRGSIRVPAAIESGHFSELCHGCRLLVEGKLGVVPGPYLIRDHQKGADPRFIGHPVGMLLHDSAKYARQYAIFRNDLAERLAAYDPSRSWSHEIDLIYAVYFFINFNLTTVIHEFGPREVLTRPERARLHELIRMHDNGEVAFAEEVTGFLTPIVSSGWPGYG